MRTIRPAILAALVLCILTGAAAAGERSFGIADWMKGESRWVGHGVGSSYTEVSKTKLPGMPKVPNMPDIPGMPKDGVMKTTTKTTLVKILPAEFVLSVETTSMGRKTVSERKEPRVRRANPDLKANVTAAGEGPIEIDGTNHTCKIWSVANFKDLMGNSMGADEEGGVQPSFGTAKVWEHPDPKVGIVQISTTMTVMGRTHEWKWTTTKLGLTRTVSGHSFACREVTLSNSMARGSTVMVVAPGFPGGSLGTTSTSQAMGMTTSSTSEVTEYVKKPLAVVTGK